ncbi:methanogenesis marker 8 protein [Methanococcus maripaludis]|uniref:Methanogenesis marker protein 8 n=2 Tax=Methanococcus maripaludis TaxID=39152 RepID=A6VHQ8_METM7|nr:methanogenesis marker 8 protein [Methanococcus maripaludis]MBA2861644.1 putative methanogenesis marker protein 8 [Methanococcus maripaludis]
MNEDIHVMEVLGNAKVTVKNGKVVDVSDPILSFCPLFAKHFEIKEINKESIQKNVEFRIESFGLFTKDRVVLDDSPFVGFGTSEIFMSALNKGFLDAVVIVSDCAGTVVTDNPKLVQGLCGRISGIIKTTPVKEVIEKIETAKGIVLSKDDASIDQINGVKLAIKMGYKKIGVSVSNLKDALEIKKLEKNDVKIITFGVHTTGIRLSDYDDYLQYIDIISACASKNLLKSKSLNIKAQAGSGVPIFALSQSGKELLFERLKEIDRPILITTNETLPYFTEPPQ